MLNLVLSKEAQESLKLYGFCVAELAHDEPSLGEKYKCEIGDVMNREDAVVSVIAVQHKLHLRQVILKQEVKIKNLNKRGGLV